MHYQSNKSEIRETLLQLRVFVKLERLSSSALVCLSMKKLPKSATIVADSSKQFDILLEYKTPKKDFHCKICKSHSKIFQLTFIFFPPPINILR